MTDSVDKSEESMLLNECSFLIIIEFPLLVFSTFLSKVSEYSFKIDMV